MCRVPARWGCAIGGRDAPRIAQKEAFLVYATAAVDMAALEAQVKGRLPALLSTPHLMVIFLEVAQRMNLCRLQDASHLDVKG